MTTTCALKTLPDRNLSLDCTNSSLQLKPTDKLSDKMGTLKNVFALLEWLQTALVVVAVVENVVLAVV